MILFHTVLPGKSYMNCIFLQSVWAGENDHQGRYPATQKDAGVVPLICWRWVLRLSPIYHVHAVVMASTQSHHMELRQCDKTSLMLWGQISWNQPGFVFLWFLRLFSRILWSCFIVTHTWMILQILLYSPCAMSQKNAAQCLNTISISSIICQKRKLCKL